MSQSLLQVPSADLAAPSLSVSRLTLYAFRNYRDIRLDLDETPVILTGANGSGKTNILEAISLLVPGRGLRRAALTDLQSSQSTEGWGLAANLATPEGDLLVGTGRDPSQSPDEPSRRVIQIDGRPIKNQQVLANHVAMTWITPDMDRVLADGPAPRRKLLDRLAYSFDPAHAGRVQRYEKAMRERLYLLREGGGDAAWFKALEDTMAQSGVAIAAARRQLLQQLQWAMNQGTSAFPQADLSMIGFAETLLADHPALLVEDRMRDELARTRTDDAHSGTCSIGPHRSDLVVIHRAKNCPADLCSTGEQKALLIAVMLAYVRTLITARQVTPLLLLDDIAAHLDTIRREALYQEIQDLHVQAWLTGTDPFQFSPLLKSAQHFTIDHGEIV